MCPLVSFGTASAARSQMKQEVRKQTKIWPKLDIIFAEKEKKRAMRAKSSAQISINSNISLCRRKTHPEWTETKWPAEAE